MLKFLDKTFKMATMEEKPIYFMFVKKYKLIFSRT